MTRRPIRNIAPALELTINGRRQTTGPLYRYLVASNMHRITRSSEWFVRAQQAGDELDEYLAHARNT